MRRFGIFPSMQSTTKLEQIGSTRDLSATKWKEVCTIQMSCPWIESRAKKDEEKTLKYGPMMWELKQRYNGYRVEQYNVIIDVLGGYSKHLEKSVRKLLGARARSVLERMQKSVISNTLNIARTCKINTWLGRY